MSDKGVPWPSCESVMYWNSDGVIGALQKCIKGLTVKWWIGVERWEIGMGSGSVPIETSSCIGSIVIADIFE